MSASAAGVVLVTHDTRDEVLAALAALDDFAGPVVVVDAGSSDGTADAVATTRPRTRVLRLVNVGFGRAANAGVAALPDDVSVAVIANADVRIGPLAIGRLVAALDADPEVALVGPRVRYPDGAHQASARRTPDVPTALQHAALGRLRPDNAATRRYHALDLTGPDAVAACDVDWVSGCAFAVRRHDFELVGGFDPGYRLFVEDVDLCVRLRARGRRIRFEPAAVVEHQVGASTRRRPFRARLLHARSLDRYLARHGSPPVRLLRPLLWPGLAMWAAATGVATARAGATRSSTGERR